MERFDINNLEKVLEIIKNKGVAYFERELDGNYFILLRFLKENNIDSNKGRIITHYDIYTELETWFTLHPVDFIIVDTTIVPTIIEKLDEIKQFCKNKNIALIIEEIKY